MRNDRPETRRRFTEAARAAAAAALAAKRAGPDRFGEPDLFVVRADGGIEFTWELRRFGGMVLQRGDRQFPDAEAAKVAGEEALSVLRSLPGMSTLPRPSDRRANAASTRL